MKTAPTFAALSLIVGLTGCNNEPEEATAPATSAVEDASVDSEPENGSLDAQTLDEGSPASDDRSDTMIRGGSDTAGTTPPKGSKLQPAD